MDNATTVQYAGLLHSLAAKTKTTVRDLEPSNELMFLRIRTNKHEIMVAPGEPLYQLITSFLPCLSENSFFHFQNFLWPENVFFTVN